MAQNITLLNIQYSDVGAVTLPKTGGGSASFTDVTDTTAAAEDVAQGKYFYTASGERTAGTATGGGGGQYEELFFAGGAYTGQVIDVPYTSIGRLFATSSGAVSVRAENITNINKNRIMEYSGVTSVFFPNAVVSISNCFDNANNLQTAVIKKCTSWTAFQNCSKLVACDILDSTGQIDNMFTNDTIFTTLVIRGSSICPLKNTSAFNNTPFKSGGAGGTIYIDKSLYDHLNDGTSLDYKAATNWTTVDGYGTITWAAIEGSYYETHYADGTVIS